MKKSLRILWLKFKGFRSFAEPQDTGELPENGLFGIIGKNNSTTGSSGSGKTNFHLALSYALGYCPFPATELQSWLTKEPMQVELGMDTPSGQVIIKRGAETSISIDGIKFEGARAVEGKLREILVWPIDLIEALTFRQQKMPGRFLAMTDSQKKEFLCSLLGLEDIENQIELANSRANEAEKEWTKESIVLDTLKGQQKKPVGDLVEIEARRAKVSAEYSLMFEQRPLIKTARHRMNKEIETLKQPEDNAKIEDLKAKLKAQIDNDETFKFLMKEQIREIGVKLKALEGNEPPHVHSAAISKLEKEIEAYRKSVCQTCAQPWHRDADWLMYATASMDELNHLFLGSIGIFSNIRKLKEEEHTLREALMDFKNERTAEIVSQLKEAELVKDANRRIKLNEIWKEQEQVQVRYDEATTKIDNLKHKLFGIDNEIRDLKEATERYERAQRDIDTKAFIVKEIKLNMDEEGDFAGMLKSFLGTIFSEVLEEIANEANDTLKQLPNVAATTIQFDTEVFSQKGKLRQEIKPVIIKNGTQIPIRSGLSGGQFTSVELATDLAIGKIIAQRTGLSLNWLILDESFEGHDVPVKEACLELLKNAAKDKLIFIIDHATEVNEYFDKCINIESNNDISNIKSIA